MERDREEMMWLGRRDLQKMEANSSLDEEGWFAQTQAEIDNTEREREKKREKERKKLE